MASEVEPWGARHIVDLDEQPMNPSFLDRRDFVALLSSFGLGTLVEPGTSLAAASTATLTPEMLSQAAKVAGLALSAPQLELMLKAVQEQAEAAANIRTLQLPHAVAPAFVFDPVLPGMNWERKKRPLRLAPQPPRIDPASPDAVAFASIRQLGALLRTGKLSSVHLTERCLARLKQLDIKLHFLVNPLAERALAQARIADRELASGLDRGPLHGIPWGAKDLFSVKGAPTTWGAAGMEQQTFETDATVVQRLDAAGAVLVAKLSLGALAMGDRWFGGRTRNPWSLEEGSSGSSAGSASAVAAGALPFALGSETYGSISSPAARCGATGLRPTFGRVPRTGAMTLSWTLDKVGPLTRTVEDAALVLSALQGPDAQDRTVREVPFNWDATVKLSRLKVGFLKEDFEREHKDRGLEEQALEKLRALGAKLLPVKLPEVPVASMLPLLTVEAAAAFDAFTRSGADARLSGQAADDWPNFFRTAQLMPAVQYINANRARTLAMEGMAQTFADLDVIVAPTDDPQLLLTNLTGHPAVVVPIGLRENGTPASLTFLGRIFGEAKMLAAARAYQEATGFHLRRPPV